MAQGFRSCRPLDGHIDGNPLDRGHRPVGPWGLDPEPAGWDVLSCDPEDPGQHWLGFRYPERSWWDGVQARAAGWRDALANAVARMIAAGQLRQATADLAKAELRFWQDNRLTRNRRRRIDRIPRYWLRGPRRRIARNIALSEAWSAAFIGYLVRESGGGTALRYAWKHVTYVKAAIEALDENRPNTYKAYRVDDPRATPTVGDIVCNWRETPRTYDEIAAMRRAHGYTHCDLVVGASDDGSRIQLIGGNKTGGVVAQVEIGLDANGLIRNTADDKYIAVLRYS